MARHGCGWHGSIRQGIALCVVGMGLWQRVPMAGAADAAPPLPRYRFEVGQELTYKGENETRYKDNGALKSFGDHDEWTVWVVRKNENGTCRLVIHSSEALWVGTRKLQDPQVHLSYCDVAADGQTTSNPSLGLHFDPSSLFPPLPPDRKSLAAGWQHLRPSDNAVSRYRLISQPVAPSGVWTFGETYESRPGDIFPSNKKSTVTFDTTRGLMTKVEYQETATDGSKTSTETRQLVSAERRDAAWITQLRNETDRYFQVLVAYERKQEEAAKESIRSSILRDEGQTLLTKARAAVHLPIVTEQLDRRLTLLDGLPAVAGDPDATVKIPTKELVAAINNHDLEWNTGFVGMMPERIRGATLLVMRYCGPEVSDQLIAALDDPERFVAAHVILGRKNLKEIKLDFNIYDQLVAAFPQHTITFDAAQRTALKRLWIGRLKPKGAPASQEPKGNLP
jgi:hypothetical protein